jgi:hypothetical protein
MKRFLGLVLVASMMVFFTGCGYKTQRSGYVSKYPCHERHACEH